jgi:hypothetical protein
MALKLTLIDPRSEFSRESAAPAPRLTSLAGKKVALLDISKPGGSVFLDRLEQLLHARYQVGSVLRAMKPTFAKPAPAGVLEQIRQADAVIEGLAD